MKKLLFLIVFLLVINNIFCINEITLTPKDYTDSQVGHIKELLTDKYDNGINKINTYLTVFISIVTVLSIFGIGSIVELRKKYGEELEKVKKITSELELERQSVKDSLNNHIKLQTETSQLGEMVKNIIEELTLSYHDVLSKVKLSPENDYKLDPSIVDEIIKKIAFMEKSGIDLNEYELFIKTIALYQDSNYKEALVDLKKLIAMNRNKPQYLFLAGLIYHSINDFENADINYSKAIEIDSNYTKAYINKAALLHENGDDKNSLAIVNRAIMINPRSLYGWNLLLKIQIDIGNIDSAEEIANKIESIDSEDKYFLYNKMHLLLKKGENDQAYELGQKLFTDPEMKKMVQNDSEFVDLILKDKKFEGLLV